MEITRISDGVWLHTSFKDLPEIGPFPTNGLIVRARDGIYLVDTAWNDEQTLEILSWVRSNLSAPIKTAIVTHAHDDKMGGINALHMMGVETFALRQTNEAAPGRGLTPAKHALALAEGIERFAGGELEAYFPGAGHTSDNIVVYIKGSHVLFGGCLIRPEASHSLGNTGDADVGGWDASVARVKARYPSARVVVPSHGPPGGADLLDHTISIVGEQRALAETK